MAVYFATSSLKGVNFGSFYSGGGDVWPPLNYSADPAVARRTGYTTTELQTWIARNIDRGKFQINTNKVFPDATPGSVWLHFRVVFPAQTFGIAFQSGFFVNIGTSIGQRCGGIAIRDQTLQAHVVNGFSTIYGEQQYAIAPGVEYTIDINFKWDGVYPNGDAETHLYINERLVSSAFSTNFDLAELSPGAILDFAISDAGNNGGYDLYFSEIIADDANSTIGCGLVEILPGSDGAQTGWTGDYTNILTPNDSNSVSSDTIGDVMTWIAAASYAGPSTGQPFRSLHMVFDTATTGTDEVIDGIIPVVRISNTNYEGAVRPIGTSSIATVDNYTFGVNFLENPVTTLPWVAADLSGIEYGFKTAQVPAP